MKKILVGILALVACCATAPVSAASFTWSGFYVGANAGYSWGNSETDVAYSTYPAGVPIVAPPGSITSASSKLNGGLGGLQAGFNWQFSPLIVAGIEGDWQWTGQKGSSDFLCSGPTFGPGTCFPGFTFSPAGVAGVSLSLDQKLQSFGTLRARLGVLPTPNWLAYVTGGLAIGRIKTDATLVGHTIAVPSLSVMGTSSDSTTKTGWALGAGVEGVIAGQWTAKIEYLYIDFGTVSGNVFVVVPGGASVQANYSSKITDNILRVGLNYHF